MTKYRLYERHKVQQYWVVDPVTEEVTIHKLKDDKYDKPEKYKKEDKVKVDIFEGLEIDLGTVNRPIFSTTFS